MIPLANTNPQINFTYANNSIPQTQINQARTQKESPIRIEQNMTNSSQNLYKLEEYSSLELQTRKDLPTQKKIIQEQIKGLEGVPFVQSASLLQTYQSLDKAQELDPVQKTFPKVSIPILKSQNLDKGAPNFKIEGLQKLRESDFLIKDNRKPGKIPFDSSGQQPNRNPYSNLYSRGDQIRQTDSEHSHHGKRLQKQIKTFKIDKIEEKKESEFTGCCGFGITDKIAFFSRHE